MWCDVVWYGTYDPASTPCGVVCKTLWHVRYGVYDHVARWHGMCDPAGGWEKVNFYCQHHHLPGNAIQLQLLSINVLHISGIL